MGTLASLLLRVRPAPVASLVARLCGLNKRRLVTGVKGCDLMKVDIEGAEFDVFMPAADVLRTGILKHVSLEIHGSILASRGLSGDALHQHMLDHGYGVFHSINIRPFDVNPCLAIRSLYHRAAI